MHYLFDEILVWQTVWYYKVGWFTIDSIYYQKWCAAGGVWSSWIFNLFMDELIYMLHERGRVCFFKGLLVGCICYADDLLLLSGSICKLQSMLNICVEFGVQLGFMFNAGKLCCLAYGEQDIINKLPEMNLDNSFVD